MLNRLISYLSLVLFLLTTVGCLGLAKNKTTYINEGTVKYIDLEGGFYGIYDEDGKKYDPVNLPREFWREGLRVEFEFAPCIDCSSFHMWGELVDIINIEEVKNVSNK